MQMCCVHLKKCSYSHQGHQKQLQIWWARPKFIPTGSNKWVGNCPFSVKGSQRVSSQLLIIPTQLRHPCTYIAVMYAISQVTNYADRNFVCQYQCLQSVLTYSTYLILSFLNVATYLEIMLKSMYIHYTYIKRFFNKIYANIFN